MLTNRRCSRSACEREKVSDASGAANSRRGADTRAQGAFEGAEQEPKRWGQQTAKRHGQRSERLEDVLNAGKRLQARAANASERA